MNTKSRVRSVIAVVVGVVLLVIWRHDLPLFIPYLSAWIIYTLYSVPPFRLKNRGGWGVLADAAGSNLFPTLSVVALVNHWDGGGVPIYWYITVGVWSLSFGIRGILWH